MNVQKLLVWASFDTKKPKIEKKKKNVMKLLGSKHTKDGF